MRRTASLSWHGILLLILLAGLLVLANVAHTDDRGVKTVFSDPNVVLGKLYEKSYAVVIGINQYPSGGGKLPSLHFAVADAIQVATQLEAMGFVVTTLLDQEATRDAIIETLADDVGKRANARDRIVFYFAGHGHTKKREDHDGFMGYILPSNYNPAHHTTTSISMLELRLISSMIQANHVLYAMDSCFSGGILTGRGPAFTQTGSGFEYLTLLAQKRAHVVITAGGKDQLVKEEGGSGIFTRIFLQALSQEKDMPWSRDGYVTAIDLASYIKKRVPTLAPNQTPQYGHLNGEGDVVLAVFKPIGIPVPISPGSQPTFVAPGF